MNNARDADTVRAQHRNPPAEGVALDRLSQRARQTLQRLISTHSRSKSDRENALYDDGLTVEDVLRLPTTIDVVTAGKVLGIGRTKAYELAKRGEFPCGVIPLGEPDDPGQRRTYRVPTAELIRLLGLHTTDDSRPARSRT